MNLIETLKSLWSRWIHKKKGPSSSNVLGFSSIPPNPADIFYSRAFLNQPNIEEEFSTNCRPQWRIRIWKDYIFASGDDSSIKRIDRATHICKDKKRDNFREFPWWLRCNRFRGSYLRWLARTNSLLSAGQRYNGGNFEVERMETMGNLQFVIGRHLGCYALRRYKTSASSRFPGSKENERV